MALGNSHILGPPVETLYFDVLQFLYHLALAVLVGGSLALGAAAAPAIFAGARSRFDGLAIFAVILLAVTSFLKATSFEVTGAPEPRLLARWGALLLLGVGTFYSSAWANPVARSIRASTPGFDDLATSAPARAEFAKLHESSRRAMSFAAVAGLVALFLS